MTTMDFNTMDQNRLDQIIAGTVMLTLSVVGNLLNISAVILIYRTSSFHNAFGFICASTLLADIGVLVIFLGWCAPSLLVGFSEEFLESYIDEVVGQLIKLFWYASIYGHLLLALNRFVAIIRPIKYNSMFSNRRVIYILAAFWLLCLLIVTVYFFEECNFTFDPDTFTWDYAHTVCGKIISLYVDLLHGTVVCVMIILIDTIAFYAIVKKYKRVLSSSVGFAEATKLKQNIRLYVQGCTQAACFTLVNLSFHIFSKLVSTKWAQFATTTFVWEVSHATDGIILIIFHKELRARLRQPWRLWRKASLAVQVGQIWMSVTTRTRDRGRRSVARASLATT